MYLEILPPTNLSITMIIWIRDPMMAILHQRITVHETQNSDHHQKSQLYWQTRQYFRYSWTVFHVATTMELRSSIIVRDINRIYRWDAISVICEQISIMRLLHLNICCRITDPFPRYSQYVFVKSYYTTKYSMKSPLSINKSVVNPYIDSRPFALDNWYSSNIPSIH